jgi:hypothetical protein
MIILRSLTYRLPAELTKVAQKNTADCETTRRMTDLRLMGAVDIGLWPNEPLYLGQKDD